MTSMKESKQLPKIPRREFLELVGLGAGALAMSTEKTLIPDSFRKGAVSRTGDDSPWRRRISSGPLADG